VWIAASSGERVERKLIVGVSCWARLLQKSQNAMRLISRQRTKQRTIADQYGFKRVTRIVSEFGTWRRSPHIINQSLHLRVKEFEADLAKRLLQQYLSEDGVIGRPSLWIAKDFGRCASG
jgi:hypothetical protein